MTRDPLARIEPVVLACLLAAAGLSTAYGLAWQWVGNRIDAAYRWGLR